MAFAVVALLLEQQVAIVEDVAGHEVVDDARHLVGGVGNRLRGADPNTLATKEIAQRGVAAVQGLGCHA